MLIISIIITIILIHCIYHFKLDIFNMLKSKMGTKTVNIYNQSYGQDYDSQINIINQSINELKTLNECIHNGKIDTAFS